jgi:hypothetical protein
MDFLKNGVEEKFQDYGPGGGEISFAVYLYFLN